MSESGAEAIARLVKGSAFLKRVREIPEDMWQLDEESLSQMARPSVTELAIKTSFWNQARIALQRNSKIVPLQIYLGLCSYQHYYHNILGRPEKLAWLVAPPTLFQLAMRSLAEPAIERVREILTLPIQDSDGNFLPEHAKLILDAFRLVAPWADVKKTTLT